MNTVMPSAATAVKKYCSICKFYMADKRFCKIRNFYPHESPGQFLELCNKKYFSVERDRVRCVHHPEQVGRAFCAECGGYICDLCIVVVEGTNKCRHCYQKAKDRVVSQKNKYTEKQMPSPPQSNPIQSNTASPFVCPHCHTPLQLALAVSNANHVGVQIEKSPAPIGLANTYSTPGDESDNGFSKGGGASQEALSAASSQERVIATGEKKIEVPVEITEAPMVVSPKNTEGEEGNHRGLGKEIAAGIEAGKSYVGKAWWTLLWYYLGLFIVGFIMNLSYLSQAKRTQEVVGQAPPGKGCLNFLFFVHVIIPILYLILWGIVGINIFS